VVEEAIEQPEDEARVPLCLIPCPRCKVAGHKGGMCHLREGHTGQHECNAVGRETHTWR
jgi:hypothetical protein